MIRYQSATISKKMSGNLDGFIEFLENLFSELVVSKDLPTLDSMKDQFAQIIAIVKTGKTMTMPIIALTPDSFTIRVPVTYVESLKPAFTVNALLKYTNNIPALTFWFRNVIYEHLYNESDPLRANCSVFSAILSMYLKKFSEEEKRAAKQLCIAFLKPKHTNLQMSLKGFAEEDHEVIMTDELENLANAGY